MILDVGCGNNRMGDVCVDVCRVSGEMGSQRGLMCTKPDVIFDGVHLPFVDRCFSEVVCFHVLEHVLSPERFLLELVRVCSGVLRVVVPHRFGRGAKMPFHRWFFNVAWFMRFFGGLRDRGLVSGFRVLNVGFWLPFKFGLVFPSEVECVVRV